MPLFSSAVDIVRSIRQTSTERHATNLPAVSGLLLPLLYVGYNQVPLLLPPDCVRHNETVTVVG